MCGRLRLALLVFSCTVLGPSAAYAQAFIVGVVRDTSGAVLPRVRVEAASPAFVTWLRPQRILLARFARISMQFDI